jgi:tetratricopeptide (TPR) repeat protein
MKTLLACAAPATISYASEPLTPTTVVTQLTVQEMERKFNFKYDEGFSYNENEINPRALTHYESTVSDKPPLEKVEERLAKPFDGLVVCKMPDPVGHGLYTSKPIPRGTVIGFYAGILGKVQEKDDYSNALSPQNSSGHISTMPAVSAKDRGGLARFMQHLPVDKKRYQIESEKTFPIVLEKTAQRLGLTLEALNQLMIEKNVNKKDFIAQMSGMIQNDELEKIQFPSEASYSNMVSSNVEVVRVVYKGLLIPVITAAQDIPAYSQLGFSYGPYWDQKEEKPLYFTTSGQILTSVQYLLDKNEEKELNDAKITYANAILDFNNKKLPDAKTKTLHAQRIFIKTCSYFSLEYANATSTLASIYRDQGDIALAIETATKAIYILETIQNKTVIAATYNKLNSCLAKLTEVPAVIKTLATEHLKQKHYQLALALFLGIVEKVPAIDKPICAYNIASCYSHLNQNDQAQHYYQMAKALPDCSEALMRKITEKLDSTPLKLNK